MEGALPSPDAGGAEGRSSHRWGAERVVLLLGAEGAVTSAAAVEGVAAAAGSAALAMCRGWREVLREEGVVVAVAARPWAAAPEALSAVCFEEAARYKVAAALDSVVERGNFGAVGDCVGREESHRGDCDGARGYGHGRRDLRGVSVFFAVPALRLPCCPLLLLSGDIPPQRVRGRRG